MLRAIFHLSNITYFERHTNYRLYSVHLYRIFMTLNSVPKVAVAALKMKKRKKARFRIKHRIHCLHARCSLLGLKLKAEEKESLLLLAASKQEQGQSVVAPTLPEKYTIIVFFSRCLRRLLGISSSASSSGEVKATGSGSRH